MTIGLIIAALAVLPADRLAMADRLFNRGDYAAAAAEYRALEGEPSLAADKILYRLGECERASGNEAAAREIFKRLLSSYPASDDAPSARLCLAMSESGEARKQALSALGTDRVPPSVRTAALYHLGADFGDRAALERCIAIEPKGRYADYARLQLARLLLSNPDATIRRKGVETLLSLAFGGGKLSEDALTLAATGCYRDRRYGEAGSLFRRALKMFPKSNRAAEARKMSAWCDFLQGRYADVIAACGDAKSDDLSYLRAAAAQAIGDKNAGVLLKSYLDDHPDGLYRADASLALARVEFAAASEAGDKAKTIESAKRAFAASHQASDALRLAWAHLRAGQPAEADLVYATVAKDFPGTDEAAQALYARAMSAARAEEWSRTELLLAEALSSNRLGETKAMALYWRGVAALRIAHEAEALGFLHEALKLGLGLDESREARLMIADADLRAGRVREAKTAYGKLVSEGACERMSAARLLSVGRLLGGDGAATCARALMAGDAADWRQAGATLLGETEESRDRAVEAMAAYRSALNEDVRTESAATAALRLGRLESRFGERENAAKTLAEAVRLNAGNAGARAEAYLELAKNAAASGDNRAARGYATVVMSLFENPTLKAEAEKILKTVPETKP